MAHHYPAAAAAADLSADFIAILAATAIAASESLGWPHSDTVSIYRIYARIYITLSPSGSWRAACRLCRH